MTLCMSAQDCQLVVVDIQQKLAPAMWNSDDTLENAYKLIQGAGIFDVPVLATEQYPEGIGPTVDLLRPLIAPENVVEKITFSSCEEPAFMEKIRQSARKQVVVMGMETHVCVLQTCLNLKEQGFDVFVVEECCSSRTAQNKLLAMERMRQNQIQVVSLEMVLFEWAYQGGNEKFKSMLSLIK